MKNNNQEKKIIEKEQVNDLRVPRLEQVLKGWQISVFQRSVIEIRQWIVGHLQLQQTKLNCTFWWNYL